MSPAQRFDPSELGDLYPWTPKQLQLASGQTLSYLDEGPAEPGEAPETLLMVHGNPTWSFYYRDLVKAFSETHRCVVPDHIGMGLSSKPQDYPYTLATHIANLEALCAQLELERVTLIVHDWGGAIGCGWALRGENLARIERLVILNTSAFRSRQIPFSIDICRIPGFGALAIRGLNAFARAAVIRAAKTKLPPLVARGYTGPYDSWANRVATLRFVEDIPMHPGIPSWPVLAEIEARLPLLAHKPALICWGGEDFCFNDHFLAEWKERLPNASVHRYAQAGHYVLEDARDEVIAQIRAFLGAEAPTALT